MGLVNLLFKINFHCSSERWHVATSGFFRTWSTYQSGLPCFCCLIGLSSWTYSTLMCMYNPTVFSVTLYSSVTSSYLFFLTDWWGYLCVCQASLPAHISHELTTVAPQVTVTSHVAVRLSKRASVNNYVSSAILWTSPLQPLHPRRAAVMVQD